MRFLLGFICRLAMLVMKSEKRGAGSSVEDYGARPMRLMAKLN
jgi:hypothetical protein